MILLGANEFGGSGGCACATPWLAVVHVRGGDVRRRGEEEMWYGDVEMGNATAVKGDDMAEM